MSLLLFWDPACNNSVGQEVATPLSSGLLGSVEGHREKRSGPDLISQERVERRAKKTGLCLRLPHSCWLGPMRKVILAEKKKKSTF